MGKVAAVVGVSITFVLACGGETQPSPSMYANVQDSSLTSVHFTTSGGISGDPAPAVDVTVTDVAKVRSIFNETRSLPPAPDGALSCEKDYGVSYHLVFSGPTGTFPFDLDPNGCNIVSAQGGGAGRIDLSSTYWADLAAALGIGQWEIYPYFPSTNASTVASTEPNDCETPNPYANVDASEVTTVHVTTTNLFPQNPNPPANIDVTVTDVAKVRAIFTETNSLPCFPKPAPGESTVTSCPVDLGIVYQLVFSGPGGNTFTFFVNASGCAGVSAGGPGIDQGGANWAPLTPQYWTDLAAALGVPESELDGP